MTTLARSFPEVTGRSLAGRTVTLPRDLQRKLNLLLVPFRERHQRHVNVWMNEAATLESLYLDLATYEVPLLPRYPRLFQRYIDAAMRNGIPDANARSRTITVYTDRGRFLRSAGLADPDQMWSALVDRDGAIRWSHVGPYTAPSAAALREVLLTGPGSTRR